MDASGTYYDVQRACIHRFLNQHDLARQVLENATASRIAEQIRPSGEMYLETARANSWFYSIFNLKGLFALAELGESLGLDLYHYETVDGKGLKRALDYLVPYAMNEAGWGFRNIGGFNTSYMLVDILDTAAIQYNNWSYHELGMILADRYQHAYNITRLTRPYQYFGGDPASSSAPAVVMEEFDIRLLLLYILILTSTTVSTAPLLLL